MTVKRLGAARRLAIDRAEARARFLATATGDAMVADTVWSYPLVTMAAAVAAGYLLACRGKGLPVVMALARLWLGGARKT